MGVGDVISICVEANGVLCGRGDTSISSVRGAGPGEEEGKGGVVTNSG